MNNTKRSLAAATVARAVDPEQPLRCTFTQGPPDCVSNLAVGGSLLVFDGDKLIGATGHYQGASGRVRFREAGERGPP